MSDWLSRSMLDSAQYELLDFGRGRKLERFGGIIVNRPSPAAESAACSQPQLWQTADASYQRAGGERGVWQYRSDSPERWSIRLGQLMLELRLTEAGQVGLFPEQSDNWRWIAEQVRGSTEPTARRILNLFAYTGASTLAAAAAGAQVVHVDAARTSVAWARRNAELSGLADLPIRWIVEDVRKFVQRELKRGNRYDAVILDPPTYGHGPRGEAWKFDEHLPALLAACGELLAEQGQFLLLTCHAPGVEPRDLEVLLRDAGALPRSAHFDAGDLTIATRTGRQLSSGVSARIGWRE